MQDSPSYARLLVVADGFPQVPVVLLIVPTVSFAGTASAGADPASLTTATAGGASGAGGGSSGPSDSSAAADGGPSSTGRGEWWSMTHNIEGSYRGRQTDTDP